MISALYNMLFTTVDRLAYHVSHFIVENRRRNTIDTTGDDRCTRKGDDNIAAVVAWLHQYPG